MSDPAYPPISPLKTGIRCRCPRCGEGALFDGFLKLKPRCNACGLDYKFADSADGPAVFIMLIAGFHAIATEWWHYELPNADDYPLLHE